MPGDNGDAIDWAAGRGGLGQSSQDGGESSDRELHVLSNGLAFFRTGISFVSSKTYGDYKMGISKTSTEIVQKEYTKSKDLRRYKTDREDREKRRGKLWLLDDDEKWFKPSTAGLI